MGRALNREGFTVSKCDNQSGAAHRYVVTGFVPYTLAAVMEREDFDHESLCKVTEQIIEAINFIHSRNICHRSPYPLCMSCFFIHVPFAPQAFINKHEMRPRLRRLKLSTTPSVLQGHQTTQHPVDPGVGSEVV